MGKIFKAPAEIQINYFKQQTGVSSTSSLDEMIIQRFVTLLAIAPGTMTASDLVWRRLNNLGYRGCLGEQLTNFFAVKSGITDRVRQEIIFFSSAANNFA